MVAHGLQTSAVTMIYGNAKSKPPARIERWNLRLQGYDFSIVHTKGSDNPSDFLSRRTNLIEKEIMAEDYVHFLSIHAVPKAMTLSEIQEATAVDPTLQQLAEIIQGEMKDQTNPDWNEVDQVQLDSLLKVKDELTVNSSANLILRGSRIVIPYSLNFLDKTLPLHCNREQHL